MRNYRQRVVRRWRWWAISTVLVLAFLLAVGYAFLSLADDVSNQRIYILLVGASFIVTAFILGQAVQSILVRSWDTWLGDLGPTQIAVLIEEMRRKRDEG